MGGALWFICILVKISLLYCFNDFFIKKLFKDTVISQLFVSLVLLITGYFMKLKGISVFSLDKVFSYYCLFYIGHLFKRYRLSDCIKKDYFRFLVLLGMFGILVLCNFWGRIELAETSYTNPLFLLITSISGWQLMYELSYFISRTVKNKNILITIGKNSLSVVVLHFLCFKIINLIAVLIEGGPLFLISCYPIYKRTGFYWCAYTFAGVGIPVFMSIFYKNIKNRINIRCLHNEQNLIV